VTDRTSLPINFPSFRFKVPGSRFKVSGSKFQVPSFRLMEFGAFEVTIFKVLDQAGCFLV
jgi:hypothetical protein